MKLSTLGEWFIILLVLIFLPKENRLMFFDTKPEDWYGEVVIDDSSNTMILAKNAKDQLVDTRLGVADRTIIFQSGQQEGIFSDGIGLILPESLAVIHISKKINDAEERTVMMDDKYYFKPGNLTLMTQSDFYTSYLLIAGLLGGFLALGFVVARYGIESATEAKVDDESADS